MARFMKKPVEVEAIQLTWRNWNEVCDFVTLPWGEDGVHGIIDKDGVPTDDNRDRIGLVIPTLEGNVIAKENDYIIKGVQGEFYPCKPDIFEQTYEKVEIVKGDN